MAEPTACAQAFFVIAVTDLDRAFDFYHRLLGAEPHYRDRGMNFVSLRSVVPGVESVILWQVPPGLPFQPSRILGSRLTCRCEDLKQSREILMERGIPVSPIMHIPGILSFVATDPDGNEIGFFEFVPE